MGAFFLPGTRFACCPMYTKILDYRAQQEMEAWQDTFPHVEFVPLPISALHLISATKEMSDNAGMLAEILADGKIGTDELEEWEQVLHSVKEQIVACTQVLEAANDIRGNQGYTR